MTSVSFKLLCVLAVSGIVAGSDPSACSQEDHDSPVCLEDRASLLQTSSIVQKRVENSAIATSQTSQEEEVMQSYSICGCSCSLSAFATSMMASSGYTHSKIQSLITEGGCSFQKMKCMAVQEARKLKRVFPDGFWNRPNSKMSGAKCSDLLSHGLSMVPPSLKVYIGMAKAKCTGIVKLDEGPFKCAAQVTAGTTAKETDPDPQAKPARRPDPDGEDNVMSQQGSTQDSAKLTVGTTANETDPVPQANPAPRQDPDGEDNVMSQQGSAQDSAEQTSGTAAKQTQLDIGDAFQQTARKNADGSLTWRQVLRVPQTDKLKREDMRKLERAFAVHDSDHDLTLQKDEVPTFVSAFRETLQASAPSQPSL